MSYEDVINIINAHYGWSMDAHEPEYKGEIKEKMQAMKQLVKELNTKAEAFDECEAKAKAWDTMKKDFEDIADTPMGQHILFNMSLIMEDVESGESDE